MYLENDFFFIYSVEGHIRNSAGPLSFAPNDLAILNMSPTIPDAVFAESESGPCISNGR